MNGRKMSKSDGNTISPVELFTGDSVHVSKGYSPTVVKFFMLQSHYRSPNDLTDEALLAAEKGFKRLMEGYKTLHTITSTVPINGNIDAKINDLIESAYADMDDDFNTPRSLAKLFELVPIINSLKEGKINISEVSNKTLDDLKSFLKTIIFDIFGLMDETESNAGPIDGLMNLIIDLRQQARVNKDWPTSDKIRDSLNVIDIQINDGKEGSSWGFK